MPDMERLHLEDALEDSPQVGLNVARFADDKQNARAALTAPNKSKPNLFKRIFESVDILLVCLFELWLMHSAVQNSSMGSSHRRPLCPE